MLARQVEKKLEDAPVEGILVVPGRVSQGTAS